jgi:hypothetical protein
VSGNNSGVVSVMGKEQKTALRQLAHNKRPLSKLSIEQVANSDLPQHINSQSQDLEIENVCRLLYTGTSSTTSTLGKVCAQ